MNASMLVGRSAHVVFKIDPNSTVQGSRSWGNGMPSSAISPATDLLVEPRGVESEDDRGVWPLSTVSGYSRLHNPVPVTPTDFHRFMESAGLGRKAEGSVALRAISSNSMLPPRSCSVSHCMRIWCALSKVFRFLLPFGLPALFW